MNNKVFPIVLSGGSGTRMWPLSRKLHPKQMLDLTGEGRSLLQSTIGRLSKLQPPTVVCSEPHRFMVAQQLHDMGVAYNSIILEPVPRNTAPAIATAALAMLEQDPEAIIAVFAADHYISNQEAFEEALHKAIKGAEEDKLMTFGIVPDRVETGYGYIYAKKDDDLFPVEKFVEKPNQELAQEYLESGEYYWNSGMFVFKASLLIKELVQNSPNIVEHCKVALENATKDLDFVRLDVESFSKCEDISIDYALMERTDKAALVPLDAGWNDIGSWDSLWNVMEKDCNGNVINGDVKLQNSKNCYVYGNEKLIALLGIEDVVVVDTDDALLISKKDDVQDVKVFPNLLKKENRSEYLHHRQVHRPWGNYDSIQSGERFQVKKLTVAPGASLSLQMHHHRAEHWVVVEGTAMVDIGENKQLLSENESVYIPLGTTHRLSNPGKIPLIIIEVQSGSYLGEDDIVRFEDVYKRVEG